MDPEDTWQQAAEKLRAWASGSVRQDKISKAPSSPYVASTETLAKAKKGELLNIRDAVERIQKELDVSQFAARETLIKVCGSGKMWLEYVLPNGGVIIIHFIDPRWWRPNLSGMKIGREFLEHGDAEFEITATELNYLFIDVQALLQWLTERGLIAKRGKLQWYPTMGDYGAKSWSASDQKGAAIAPNLLAVALEDGGVRPVPTPSNAMIHEAISDLYSESERTRQKPPNIKEIVSLVQARLAAKGYAASGRQIQSLAEADKYKKRRRKPGRTLANEKRRRR
jgi:hypothetical protein